MFSVWIWGWQAPFGAGGFAPRVGAGRGLGAGGLGWHRCAKRIFMLGVKLCKKEGGFHAAGEIMQN